MFLCCVIRCFCNVICNYRIMEIQIRQRDVRQVFLNLPIDQLHLTYPNLTMHLHLLHLSQQHCHKLSLNQHHLRGSWSWAWTGSSWSTSWKRTSPKGGCAKRPRRLHVPLLGSSVRMLWFYFKRDRRKLFQGFKIKKVVFLLSGFLSLLCYCCD